MSSTLAKPRSALARLGPSAIVLVFCAAASTLVARTVSYETVDYAVDAGPAIHALATVDPDTFFRHEPQMGAFSLLLRWPFASLASIWGGGWLDEYRFGLVPCLFLSALGAVYLGREMARARRGAAAIGAIVGLWFLNPAALQAVNIGHPEELLAGALCVFAALTVDRAQIIAAVALGLALATKQWALVAVLPVILGAQSPPRTLLVALAVWLPLELPLLVGNFDAYMRVREYGVVVGVPAGAWWPVQDILPADVITSVARPSVVLAGLLVPVAAWKNGGGGDLRSRLALLGLVFLLRILLDPTGNLYFAVPFLMTLLALDGLVLRSPPLLSLGVIALLAVTFSSAHVLRLSPTAIGLLYLAWSLPLGGWLWRAAGTPRVRIAASSGPRAPVQVCS